MFIFEEILDLEPFIMGMYQRISFQIELLVEAIVEQIQKNKKKRRKKKGGVNHIVFKGASCQNQMVFKGAQELTNETTKCGCDLLLKTLYLGNLKVILKKTSTTYL